MHITLIGMSSIGKSHWAAWLASHRGFLTVDCDRLIEQKLKEDGIRFECTGTQGLAQWMGRPHDPHYAKSSIVYLDHEKTVMRDVIAMLRTAPPNANYVIDSTGSVIYLGDEIIDQLKALSRVVYLEASREHGEELFIRDQTEPKPLIWDSSYAIRPGERPEDARRRCFPALLEHRAVGYAKMAHMTIPYEKHLKLDTNMDLLFGRGA